MNWFDAELEVSRRKAEARAQAGNSRGDEDVGRQKGVLLERLARAVYSLLTRRKTRRSDEPAWRDYPAVADGTHEQLQ